MNFFEPPPPPPEEETRDRTQPMWLGPPDNVLGVGVPIRLVLARTDELAVLLNQVSAYPNGFTFEISLLLRQETESHMDLSEVMDGGMRRLHKASRELPPDLFRFGIRFADGSKVTNIDPGRWPKEDDEEPAGPLLVPRGGGGGGARWQQDYWVWPLPPEGPMAFVCEWPSRGIQLTEREVDATSIREAASAAEVLWPGPRPSQRSGIWFSS